MTNLLLRIFVKNREKTDDPAVRTAYGTLSGVTGIVCNLLLCAAKFFIGLLSGSVSITADAVNNLTDAASSVVTIVGFRMAAKPADKDHPYGHARVEYLSALAVAAVIFLMGYELAKASVDKIVHPSPVEFSAVTAVVLVLSIGVKLWLSCFNGQLGKRINSGSLLATAADSRNDVISTAAVLVSCIIGAVTSFNPDGYIGLAVALFILYSGFNIAKDTIDPLLGSAPDAEFIQEIAEELKANEHVLGIHDLMVHDYGPGRRFASVHVEMDRNLDPLYSHNIIDRLEMDFMEKKKLEIVIHYDPVVTDDETVNEAKKATEGIVQRIDSHYTLHDFRMVDGPLHTNLIFDLVVPFDHKENNDALIAKVCAAIKEHNPNYRAVICIDNDAFNCLP